MDTNELLIEQLFEIIRSQIKSDKPPEAKLTFERLFLSLNRICNP
jgi:hypothetical protein